MYGGASHREMKKYILISVVFIDIFLICLHILEAIVVTYWRPKQFIQTISPFRSYVPAISEGTYNILHTILNTYLTTAWAQSFVSCICFSHLLKEEFKKITEEFGKSLILSPDAQKEVRSENIRKDIEHYRIRHLDLCHIVWKYDSGVSVNLLFLFVMSIPIIIILMYALWGLDREIADVDDSPLSFWLSVIYLLCFILVLVSVIVSGAALAEAVSNDCL